MDKKSKYIIGIFIIFSLLVAGWGYYTFLIKRDFSIHNTTTCDPELESCFVWCEEGECEEDYYKKIIKNASNIDLCNPALEDCEPLICEPGEENCQILECSEENLEEEEMCTNPIDFQPEELVEEIPAEPEI